VTLKKKKKGRQNFFWTEILEVGLRVLKRSPNIPASRAPKLISPYALGGGGRKIHKFALGAEMASHGPGCHFPKRISSPTIPDKFAVREKLSTPVNTRI
jgi:hypothetical protein